MHGTVYFLVLLLWVLSLVYGLLGSFKDSLKILKVQNANKCQWARPLQSIYTDPQSQARGLLLHGLPCCSELLLITSGILSYILFFLWHYSDFGERNEALGSSPCFLLQPLPSLRSLVSVPKSASSTNPYTQVTETDSTACPMAFSSSSRVPNLLFPLS